jgi:Ca2+-binding EF-hand superfamily protein
MLIVLTTWSLAAADVELVLRGNTEVSRLNMAVEVEGRAFDVVWDEVFVSLFDFYDRDHDRRLSREEVSRLPSVQSLREVLGAGFTPMLGGGLTLQDIDTDGDDFASQQEISVAYRRAGIGRPLVGAGITPHTEALNQSLLKLLDTNSDSQVSTSELADATNSIGRFDRNDDEMIGAGELVAAIRYPGAAGSFLLKPNANAPQSGEVSRIAAALLPLAPDHPFTKHFPADDSPLTYSAKLHLTTLPKVSADVTPQPTLPTIKVLHPVEAKEAGGTHLISSPGLSIALRTDPGNLRLSAHEYSERLQSRFHDDDTSDDDMLDKGELEKAERSEWQTLLVAADRNGDEQLSRGELDAWLKLQRQLTNAQVLVTLLDCGQGLFELLDENHDGALSAGELHDAKDVVSRAGAL